MSAELTCIEFSASVMHHELHFNWTKCTVGELWHTLDFHIYLLDLAAKPPPQLAAYLCMLMIESKSHLSKQNTTKIGIEANDLIISTDIIHIKALYFSYFHILGLISVFTQHI